MSARRLRTGVIRPWRGKSEWAVPLLLFLAIVLVAALAFNVANLDTGGEAIPGGGVSGGTSPSALGVFDPFLGDVFLVIFASVVVAMLVVAVLRRRVQQKAPAKPFSWWQVISSAIGLILVFALLLAWPRMIQAFRIGQTPPTTGDAGGASATGWPVAAGAPLGLFLGLTVLVTIVILVALLRRGAGVVEIDDEPSADDPAARDRELRGDPGRAGGVGCSSGGFRPPRAIHPGSSRGVGSRSRRSACSSRSRCYSGCSSTTRSSAGRSGGSSASSRSRSSRRSRWGRFNVGPPDRRPSSARGPRGRPAMASWIRSRPRSDAPRAACPTARSWSPRGRGPRSSSGPGWPSASRLRRSGMCSATRRRSDGCSAMTRWWISCTSKRATWRTAWPGSSGRAPAAASSPRSATSSRGWRRGGERRLRPGGRQRSPRRGRDRDRRQARGPGARPLGDPRRRSSADRRRPGPGEDADREVVRRRPRPLVPTHPVHTGPAPGRHHRDLRLRAQDGRFHPPARAGLHERPPRGRDQPRAAEDPIRAARGDAGTTSHPGGRDVSIGPAVLRDRDAESDRARRHLSAPRGAGRPVPAENRCRLSDAGAGDRSPRASTEATRGRRDDRGRDDAR